MLARQSALCEGCWAPLSSCSVASMASSSGPALAEQAIVKSKSPFRVCMAIKASFYVCLCV